jgi:ketosteroid isomerase-like protein
MTDREAIRTLIVGAYAARDRGDIEALMSAFHPDAVFELKGAKTALEVAGAVRGHPEVRASLGGFIETFKFDNRKIISVVIDGERAAVHSSFDVTFKAEQQNLHERSARLVPICGR